MGEAVQGRSLAEGTWYWRIAAEGTELYTQPKRFIVAPPLPPPVPAAPADNGRVVLWEGGGIETEFRWENAEGAEYYQFRLYHGEQVVSESNVPASGDAASSILLDINTFAEGSYNWTVQGFSRENMRSTRRTGLLASSGFAARRIRPASLDYPEDGITLEGLQARREPGTARWSSDEILSTSRFVLSRNRTMASPEDVQIDPGKSIELPPLGEGEYYWTIEAETIEGYDISAREIRRITVLPIPLLSAAANRLPVDGHVIGPNELRTSETISFSWNPVPGASAYLFTLIQEQNADGAALNRELINTRLAENRYVIEDLSILDRGTFVWRIEAVLIEPVRGRREEEIIQHGEKGENRFSISFNSPDAPEGRQPGALYGR
jgi:hypothetical protein